MSDITNPAVAVEADAKVVAADVKTVEADAKVAVADVKSAPQKALAFVKSHKDYLIAAASAVAFIVAVAIHFHK